MRMKHEEMFGGMPPDMRQAQPKAKRKKTVARKKKAGKPKMPGGMRGY